MTIGLDYIRRLRARGQEPSHPVIVSTVGEVGENLHVHLDLSANPVAIDWSPLQGLNVLAAVGKGEVRRLIPHAARLLRYAINQGNGWRDYLFVWDTSVDNGVHLKWWKAIRSPYHELCREETVDVMPLLPYELRDLREVWA